MIKIKFRFSTIVIIFALVASFILISCSSTDEKKADVDIDVENSERGVLSSLNITRDNSRLIKGNPFVFKTTGTDTDMIFVDNLSDKSIEWKVLNIDNTTVTDVEFIDGINNKNEVNLNFSKAGNYKILTKWTDSKTSKEHNGLKKITIYESNIPAKLITSIIHDTPKKGVMNFKATAQDPSDITKTYKWKVTKYNSIDEIENIIATDTALSTTIDFTKQSVGRYILSLYVFEAGKQIDDYEGSIYISDEEGFSIAIGDNHTLIADLKSDLLYVYGVNDNGQLGTGNNDNITTPTILKNSNVRFIKQVSAGKNHSLLLAGNGKTDNGLDNKYKVYSWGDNAKGQLGNDTTDDNNAPAVVSTMKATTTKDDETGATIIVPTTDYYDEIGAGGDQSFAYNNYKPVNAGSGKTINTVLAQWGSDNSSDGYSNIPKYASEGPRGGILKGDIQFLKVGTNHIIFRYTWAYNVSSFGSNSHGQAGKCETVAYGTAACTRIGGDVLTGNGNYHGAGYRPKGSYYLYYPYVYAPRKENGANVGYVENVAGAAAGDNFSLIIRQDGSLYSFGQNSKGQLGLGNDTETGTKTENKFQPIKVFQGRGTQGDTVERKEIIVDIATGYSHAYAIDKMGKLFTWGDNSKGQLLRDPQTATEFSDIPTEVVVTGVDKVLDIWAGANRSIALGSDKNLYTWGENKSALKLLGVEEVGEDKDYNSVPTKMMFPLADIGH